MIEAPFLFSKKRGEGSMDEKELEEKKQMILDFFQDKSFKPMKFKELCYVLDVKPEDRERLMEVLNALLNEYKITKTKNGKYMKMPENMLTGTFVGNKRGFGFVTVEGMDEDFFVHEKDSMNAFHGDKVLIRVDRGRTNGPRKEAEVVKIIGRGIQNVIGTYEKGDGFGFVIPDDRKIAKDIFVPMHDAMGAVDGSKVVVEITDYGDSKKSPSGVISEILGHINDPGSDIITVVRSHDLPVDFPDDVMDFLLSVPDEVLEEEKKERRDFRMLDTVTIDGEDAKDLDDAITLTYEDGIYHLGVHIADVTHYVREKSPLDKEALKRGTSVYLVDKVIPMLPHKLSNGICSLNAGCDRLTLSCLMDIDESGKVISHEICEGVICVNERMNYTDVNKMLTNAEDAPYDRYRTLLPMFERMLSLSQLIRERRKKRGSIDFDIPEAKIIVDKNHKPVDITEHERNAATKIIEDFMLMANETIAEDYFWQEIPFEYRTHDTPNEEKVEALAYFIRNFGLYFKVGREKIHPKEFQKLLDKIEGQPYEAMISKMTLRTMQQARYSTECTGHFGLACKYYCHFTSPIRRYPDLQIHRIIKENLHGELTEERRKHYRRLLPKVAEDNSIKERRAEEAERDVVKLKEIEYMSEHIGEEFDGIISGFTASNIFVELPNTVEGAVNVSNITDDNYFYHEAEYAMIGERTGRKFSLGDNVRIQVLKCDKVSRMIDFIFVEKEE